jgi:hypothetical protein
MQTKHQISPDAIARYRVLETFAAILIPEPKPLSQRCPIHLDIPQLLLIASELKESYDRISNLCTVNQTYCDISYEEIEESIGCAQCEYITTMCYYLGLTIPETYQLVIN